MWSISEFWLHIGDMHTTHVPLDCSQTQYHLAHVIRQAIDARTDMAQVLEHDVAGLVRHWSVSAI